MDQTRPMEAGKEVKCSKGKRGRREAGQVMLPLRLVAPGGPADIILDRHDSRCHIAIGLEDCSAFLSLSSRKL